MKIKAYNTVFVFDLDDTLYQEVDYQLSGVSAVATKVQDLFNIEVHSKLKKLIADGEDDPFGAVCNSLNLPLTVKESLLWEYRLHEPKISLRPAVKSLLEILRKQAVNISILTDGRVITQMLKLKALGLDDFPVYISEQFGEPKPHPERYNIISCQYPGRDFIYIGDNPRKDFLTPNALGWTTFGVIGNERNVHSQNLSELDSNSHPNCWLKQLEDLQNFLC